MLQSICVLCPKAVAGRKGRQVPIDVEVLIEDPLLRELVEARAVALGCRLDSHARTRIVRRERPVTLHASQTEVVITDFPDAEALDQCGRRTLVAMLMPTSPPEFLDLALTIGGRGDGLVLDPLVAARLAARSDRRQVLSGGSPLTPRESDIVRHMASGQSLKQIANVLGVTQKTIENQTTKLYAKLGVTNRREAVSRAVELGVIPGSVE